MTQPEAARRKPGGSAGPTLAWCALLSLGFAVVMTLSFGEVRTQVTRASLERYTDFRAYAWHRLNDTGRYTHPVYAEAIEKNGTASVALSVALTRVGIPFGAVVALMVIMIRAMFGTGMSWLVYASTRRRSVALLSVVFAYGIPRVAEIYEWLPKLSIMGTFTVSLFLAACALSILGARRWALGVWLFQLWVHPITFVCWAPLFLGLWLSCLPSVQDHLSARPRMTPLLLALGPLLAGLAAGSAEAAGLLPFRADDAYWALIRVRSMHTVFLFTKRAALPLFYLSEVAALLLISSGEQGRASPLHLLNRWCAFLGCGLGLLYLVCAETGFSALAAMCLPLRFETVMVPVLLANLFHMAACEAKDKPQLGVLAFSYGALLFVPWAKPLLWAWLWALAATWWRSDASRARAWGMWASGLGCLGCYAHWAASTAGYSFPPQVFHASAAILLIFLPAVLVSRLTSAAQAGLAAAMCAAAFSGNASMGKARDLVTEIRALTRGLPEQSPQKEACDWLNALEPGTAVLSHQDVFLHVATRVRTSLNLDLMGFSIYMPSSAPLIADEIRAVYGVDLAALAQERRSLAAALDESWPGARDKVLGGACPAGKDFRYVVEPVHIRQNPLARVVFSNAFVRIYRVPARDHA